MAEDPRECALYVHGILLHLPAIVRMSVLGKPYEEPS